MAEINMKTIDLKGKQYVPVNERIKVFRAMHPDWSMITEVIELTEDRCVLRAVIRDEAETIRATGLAYELATSSYVNKTSYIENCETSAWGRALGCLGIGVDTSIASADEMLIALQQQEANDKKAKPAAKGKQQKPKAAEEADRDFIRSKFDAAIKAYMDVTGCDKATTHDIIEGVIQKKIDDVTKAELREKLTIIKKMIDDMQEVTVNE